VEISIDDFGTGYSSLAYLRRFPIDKLKIDIGFIRDVTSSGDAAAIVLAILRMAQTLKLETIAEGVETAGQVEFLRDHGCDLIQGYYFSRPLPEPQLAQLVRPAARCPRRRRRLRCANLCALQSTRHPPTVPGMAKLFFYYSAMNAGKTTTCCRARGTTTSAACAR
jgi:predicted signal transduction protein with EAL and GGDEF domain